MKPLFLALMFAATTAFGQLNSQSVQNAGFDKLTEAQKAEMLSTIAKQAETNASTKTPASVEDVDKQIQKVDKWVQYGSNIGKGLVGAAHELGVEANQFARTPVGFLATVVIAWHFMGDAIGIPIHLIGGVLIFIFGNLMLIYIARQKREEKIVYTEDEKKQNKTVTALNDDWQIGLYVGYAVILIVSIATAFSYSVK